MKLFRFEVQNFRSVLNSGPIDVSDQTAILGPNECGKSNILLALNYLNPVDSDQIILQHRDFPKEKFESAKPNIKFITTYWNLNKNEQTKFGEIWRGKGLMTKLRVSKDYSNNFYFDFISEENENEIFSIKKIMNNVLNNIIELQHEEYERSFSAWQSRLNNATDFERINIIHSMFRNRRYRDIVKRELGKDFSELWQKIELPTKYIFSSDNGDISNDVIDYTKRVLPKFSYIEDYQFLNWEVDLKTIKDIPPSEYTNENKHFMKMCDIANIDIETLIQAEENSIGTKKNYLNRAGVNFSKKISKIWRNKSIDVEFEFSGCRIQKIFCPGS